MKKQEAMSILKDLIDDWESENVINCECNVIRSCADCNTNKQNALFVEQCNEALELLKGEEEND